MPNGNLITVQHNKFNTIKSCKARQYFTDSRMWKTWRNIFCWFFHFPIIS